VSEGGAAPLILLDCQSQGLPERVRSKYGDQIKWCEKFALLTQRISSAVSFPFNCVTFFSTRALTSIAHKSTLFSEAGSLPDVLTVCRSVSRTLSSAPRPSPRPRPSFLAPSFSRRAGQSPIAGPSSGLCNLTASRPAPERLWPRVSVLTSVTACAISTGILLVTLIFRRGETACGSTFRRAGRGPAPVLSVVFFAS